MAILFTDLDSTLIYSHRRDIGEDKVLVERLDGREQSFMTKKAYTYLKEADWLKVVPVTARTKEQYSRIFSIGKPLPAERAIICYGGELLINGEEDSQWHEETMELVRDEIPSVSRSYEKLIKLTNPAHVYFPAPYLCYAVCENVEELAAKLREDGEITSGADVICDGRKMYCLACSINKGRAIERYRTRFGREKCAAAGDSGFDIPMLMQADAALAADRIFDDISGREVYALGSGEISDMICDILERLRTRGFFESE